MVGYFIVRLINKIKYLAMPIILALLFTFNLEAQNLVPNGSFDEVTDVYYTMNNNLPSANCTYWKEVGSPNFYKDRNDHKNFVGLISTGFYPLEYIYTTLSTTLIPNRKYKLSIRMLRYIKSFNLNILLIKQNDTLKINEFTIPELAKNITTTVINITSNDAKQKRCKDKWCEYIVEFTVVSKADVLIIGNYVKRVTKSNVDYDYYYCVDDIIIEDLSKNDQTLTLPVK